MSPIALVVGASRGIGAAVARELRDRGWTVVGVARRGEVKADVSTPAGAKKAVGTARKLFGRLDLLVVAAGDFAWTPVSKVDVKAFDRIFDSNLRTAWLCAKEALPLLRKSKGSIVLFGGTVTQRVRGNPKAVAYAMAKTALTVFATSLARAEKDVRVNMVNPGIIEGGIDLPGRKGKPEEVAKAVAWLASHEASHVSGAVLDVGGGLYT
ncbi:MAG TPA: SDR family oxidoreductase [Planctomycetota bacterium]